MQPIFVLCLILSVTVVYGGVSFRNIRSAYYQPYGSGGNVQPYRHPTPGYNRTGEYATRVPQHLPAYRPSPTFNQTRTPGLYQPTYNQTRPVVANYPQHPAYPSRFGNNATRNATSGQLYPDLSNRFRAGATGGPSYTYSGPVQPNPAYGGRPAGNVSRTFGNNVNPAPVQPYQPYGGGVNPTPVQPYPAFGGGAAPNTNPSYGGGIQPYGGGAAPNTNPSYGGGVQPYGSGAAPNTNPSYGGGVQPYGSGAAPNTNPSYGGGVQPYGGGAAPNQGASTWGHPNYQAPNSSQPAVPAYYNPRVYA